MPGAAAFAARSWSRSVGSPVMAPLTSRAPAPRKAALLARCATVRWPSGLANSGVMLVNRATASAPMPDRQAPIAPRSGRITPRSLS